MNVVPTEQQDHDSFAALSTKQSSYETSDTNDKYSATNIWQHLQSRLIQDNG